MRRETSIVTLSVCLTIVAAGALVARGGPLDPPGGAITPTFKTLDEVEPRVPISLQTTPGDADSLYRITEAGSYYLDRNLIGANAKHGIEIAAAGVTLDLNGFTLTGGAGSLDAIHVSAAFPLNISVRNGAIESWTGDGIDAASASGMRIDGVAVTLCQGTAMFAGANARVTHCTASFITIDGINVGDGSIVSNCRVSQVTGSIGIYAGTACTITDSTASLCGLEGFFVGYQSTIRSCVADSNGDAGFRLLAQGTMNSCVATRNNAGIVAASSVVSHSVAAENTLQGIAAGHSTITNCQVNQNGSHGIEGAGSVITGCVSTFNGASGIAGLDKSSVESCISRSNTLHGVAAGSGSRIVHNNCVNNGAGGVGAGIYVSGNDNRLEDNLLESNDYGLDIDGVRNLIIRNHARANGANYSQIGAGNFRGTICTDQNSMNVAVNANVNWSF